MSKKKPVATQEDIDRFISLIYPGTVELAKVFFSEKKCLNDASDLIESLTEDADLSLQRIEDLTKERDELEESLSQTIDKYVEEKKALWRKNNILVERVDELGIQKRGLEVDLTTSEKKVENNLTLEKIQKAVDLLEDIPEWPRVEASQWCERGKIYKLRIPKDFLFKDKDEEFYIMNWADALLLKMEFPEIPINFPKALEAIDNEKR